MSTYESQTETVTVGEQLADRDVRALTECMTVLPDGGNIFTVVGENGQTHRVDAKEDRCTCEDYQYNLPTDDGRETCKHRARVAFASSEQAIPAWVNLGAVDDLLGEHLNVQPRVAATDGGIIEAGDDGVILEDQESDDDGRPEDCDCGEWNADYELCCWPCYREGFRQPAGAEGDE
jgi:hypothetical protein